MDFRQLRYFIAVAEERHFRRAAERLHMSQPPLSQQIAALEEELGTTLLARDRRSVRLTPSGEVFLRRARTLLEEASNAATEARRIGRGEAGRLVLGFMSAAMLGRFPPLLRKFQARTPGVVVDLIQMPPKEQIEATASGRIDIAFLAIAPAAKRLYVDREELESDLVWEEELVAALPIDHPLANRPAIALRELANDFFITLPRAPQTGHYDRVLQLCQTKGGFRATVGQEVEQLPAALALIAAGKGVSLVPCCAVEGWKGTVAFPRLKERSRIPVVALWRTDNSSPVLRAFRQVLPDRSAPVFFPAGSMRGNGPLRERVRRKL